MKTIFIILMMLASAAIVPWDGFGAPADTLSARDLYLEKDSELLGLKCRLLQRDVAGRFMPVKPDSVFHTGDHIRLELSSNAAGYLYVLQHGSDSTWQVLFPSAGIRDNDNRTQPNQAVEVPRGQDFYFDETPGREHLFVVLTRDPEPDLERWLTLMRAQPKGANDAAGMPALFQLVASQITTDLRSRNLRVSQATTAAENAVYFVNAERAGNRVAVEIVLSHDR